MKKYRIKLNDKRYYEAQYRTWWWPFWRDCFYYSWHVTLESMLKKTWSNTRTGAHIMTELTICPEVLRHAVSAGDSDVVTYVDLHQGAWVRERYQNVTVYDVRYMTPEWWKMLVRWCDRITVVDRVTVDNVMSWYPVVKHVLCEDLTLDSYRWKYTRGYWNDDGYHATGLQPACEEISKNPCVVRPASAGSVIPVGLVGDYNVSVYGIDTLVEAARRKHRALARDTGMAKLYGIMSYVDLLRDRGVGRVAVVAYHNPVIKALAAYYNARVVWASSRESKRDRVVDTYQRGIIIVDARLGRVPVTVERVVIAELEWCDAGVWAGEGDVITLHEHDDDTVLRLLSECWTGE